MKHQPGTIQNPSSSSSILSNPDVFPQLSSSQTCHHLQVTSIFITEEEFIETVIVCIEHGSVKYMKIICCTHTTDTHSTSMVFFWCCEKQWAWFDVSKTSCCCSVWSNSCGTICRNINYVVSFLGTHKKNFISHLHLNKQQSGEYEYLTNTYELQLNYSLL